MGDEEDKREAPTIISLTGRSPADPARERKPARTKLVIVTQLCVLAALIWFLVYLFTD